MDSLDNDSFYLEKITHFTGIRNCLLIGGLWCRMIGLLKSWPVPSLAMACCCTLVCCGPIKMLFSTTVPIFIVRETCLSGLMDASAIFLWCKRNLYSKCTFLRGKVYPFIIKKYYCTNGQSKVLFQHYSQKFNLSHVVTICAKQILPLSKTFCLSAKVGTNFADSGHGVFYTNYISNWIILLENLPAPAK
jgi:hypothetical protein